MAQNLLKVLSMWMRAILLIFIGFLADQLAWADDPSCRAELTKTPRQTFSDEPRMIFGNRSVGQLKVLTSKPRRALFSGMPILDGEFFRPTHERRNRTRYDINSLRGLSQRLELAPTAQQRFDSTGALQSPFLRRAYARRLWDEEFSELATDSSRLNQLSMRGKRVIVTDDVGEIVASALSIYSPYLVVSGGDLENAVTLPWMDGEELLRRLTIRQLEGEGDSFDLLPVESFFEQEFSRPATGATYHIRVGELEYTISIGVLVELGSYAIDLNHPLRREAGEELYYELLMMMFDAPYAFTSSDEDSRFIDQLQERSSEVPLFSSYGESVGQRFYRPMGFAALQGEGLDRYGVSWSALAASQNMVFNYGERRGMDQVVARVFRELETQASNPGARNENSMSMAEEWAYDFRLSQFNRSVLSMIEPEIRRHFLAPFLAESENFE